jgi:hypothetical protein
MSIIIEIDDDNMLENDGATGTAEFLLDMMKEIMSKRNCSVSVYVKASDNKTILASKFAEYGPFGLLDG